MSETVKAFVCEARLQLVEGIDPDAVGGAVTVALCGHWDHPPPCRWPHNNDGRADGDAWLHRTLCVAPVDEIDGVRKAIEVALRGEDGWSVVEVRERPIADDEQALAASLLAGPRREVEG